MGQRNEFFQLKVFVQWVGNAVYHSIVVYIFSQLFWYNDLKLGDGTTSGHWLWGTALYGAILLTVLGKAALITSNWTKYHVLAIPGSLAIWYVFVAVYGTVAPMAGVSKELRGIVPEMFVNPVFWLQMIVLPVMCLARDFAWKFAKRMYRPQTYHHIQEIQKYNIQDYRPRYVTPPFLLLR
jgi:phospholipid-transporting ATPase